MQLASWSEQKKRWGVCSFRKHNGRYYFKCGMCWTRKRSRSCHHFTALKVVAMCHPCTFGSQLRSSTGSVQQQQNHMLIRKAVAACLQKGAAAEPAAQPHSSWHAVGELRRQQFARFMSGAATRFVRFPAEPECSRADWDTAQVIHAAAAG